METIAIYKSKGSEHCTRFVPLFDLPLQIRNLVQNGEVYGIYQERLNDKRCIAELVDGKEIKFQMPYKIHNFI